MKVSAVLMKAKAIKAHLSSYPNPISFKPGDTLSLGVRDNEYKGWIRVTTFCGNEGWAPEQYIDSSQIPAIALQAYSAVELNIQPGDHLSILKQLNEWAWVNK